MKRIQVLIKNNNGDFSIIGESKVLIESKYIKNVFLRNILTYGPSIVLSKNIEKELKEKINDKGLITQVYVVTEDGECKLLLVKIVRFNNFIKFETFSNNPNLEISEEDVKLLINYFKK